MVRGSALAVLCFLVSLAFLTGPSEAQESFKIGYVRPNPKGADGDVAAYSYGLWVLEGLEFFAKEREEASIKSKEANGDRLEWKGVEIVEDLAPDNNESTIAERYFTLIEQSQVDVVIGPVTEAYTVAALEGIKNASRAVPVIVLSATDRVLAAANDPAHPVNIMTLMPPDDVYLKAIEWLPAFQEFLSDRKLHLYAILALGPDPSVPFAGNGSSSGQQLIVDQYAFLQEEVEFVRWFAQNVSEQLVQPETSTDLVYTLQSFTWFSTLDEFREQVVDLARVRPRPQVLMLATPQPVDPTPALQDPPRAAWNDEYLGALMQEIASAGLEPGAIYFPLPIDLPDEREEQLRKRLRSVCYNALWADTLDLSGGLGSAEEFARDFEDAHDRPPSQWVAVGAAHALLAQLWAEHATPSEWISAQRVDIDEETFYARVRILAGGNGTNENARVHLAQFRGGQSRIIGEDGPVDGLSYRGRWDWIDYSLEGSAIAALVIAALLAVLALALIIGSIVKFVRLFISPPEEDEDDEDEDKKKSEGDNKNKPDK